MQYLQWIIKGMAMGAADVVPGVSGGTLAFILGIYERLLGAISSVNLTALKLLLRGQWQACWRQIDGTFLLCLFGGVLVSIFSLATVISWLLEHRPVPLWAFFNGLILGALPLLLRAVRWSALRVLLFSVGIVLALLVGMLAPVSFTPATWMFFVAGAIAICAMILPGISGSFILLISGMYAPVILAVRELHVGILLLFVTGCVVGLLSFSRFLNWLLKHYHDATLALLTGVVVGATYRLWPWQAGSAMYSPSSYAARFGQHDLLLAIGCFLVAIFVMLALLNLEKLLGGSTATTADAATISRKE
jgi:putative membrane protein